MYYKQYTYTFFTVDKPNLLTLLHFPYGTEFEGDRNIISRVAPVFRCIGTWLLNDKNGSIVEGIHMTNSCVVKHTMHEIFYEWLQMDTECSWQKVIESLKISGLCVLAKNIEDALKQRTQKVIAGLLKTYHYLISCAYA